VKRRLAALRLISRPPTKCAAALLACDGEADHLHMLAEYPPKHSLSILVNAFTGTSRRLLRKQRPDIASRYRDGVLWSPTYFAASTGHATLDAIKQYLELQRQRFLPALKGEASGR
jgi:putative transposase